MHNKRWLAAAGFGALVLIRQWHTRVGSLPTVAQQALRRRRYGLPPGVEEYRPALVDRRSSTEQGAHVAAGSSASEVVADYYQEQPNRS